jgi:ABC-2 type transport system permease protein
MRDSGQMIAQEVKPESARQQGLRHCTQRAKVAPVTKSSSQSAPAPLILLLRIHAIQLWRSAKSLRKQSRLLSSVIGSFILGYLILSFLLFSKGLRFVASFPGLGTVLTERLLYLLFAFLFALLLLSNLVISYTNFFRNRESAFLLTQPVPWETIFRWKFLESTLLASWAFLFLIAPLLAAFGLTREAPWHFYLVTLALTGLFIVLPGVAGAWVAIHLARNLDRRSFQIALISGAVVLLALTAFWWKAQPVTDDVLESRVLEVLDQLLAKTRFALFPFLPSYWLSSAVLQWADGAISSAIFFALVLLSNALFFGSLAFTRLGQAFYDSASAVQSRGSVWGRKISRTRSRPQEPAAGPVEKFVALFKWLNRDTRALVVKDTRMFWRDTAQWGQSVMLFGLLGVYIINLRHFTHQLSSPFWINLISYLNLSACSLNLATLTTRFVYPQFSLEGQRLWIIGMAPLGLARVVKVKYWLASLASLAVTLTLITLSCHLLKMRFDQLAFFGAVVTVMTFSLNGLAVGLGVLYPNLKETNSSKIVSGFGGTLCLVLSFLYILGSVLLLAVGTAGFHARVNWVIASISTFAALSFVVGFLPLRLGLRQLKKFEF